MMRLTERDLGVLQELDRWRFALSRQLRFLCSFPSQRTCDRRLKALIEAGYVSRKHVLYGVPGLYFPTHKGKALINASTKPDKFKLEQIHHDIAVIDAAIYFHLAQAVPLSTITTEKELHQRDGFGIRRHQPDFTFTVDGKITCVEVELTPKSKDRLVTNLQDNFLTYESQVWVVPKAQGKILRLLESQTSTFPNIEVVHLEGVTNFVNAQQLGSSGEVDHAGQ
jgi:DNA-binding HxlR family transcriptional regulator